MKYHSNMSEAKDFLIARIEWIKKHLGTKTDSKTAAMLKCYKYRTMNIKSWIQGCSLDNAMCNDFNDNPLLRTALAIRLRRDNKYLHESRRYILQASKRIQRQVISGFRKMNKMKILNSSLKRKTGSINLARQWRPKPPMSQTEILIGSYQLLMLIGKIVRIMQSLPPWPPPGAKPTESPPQKNKSKNSRRKS